MQAPINELWSHRRNYSSRSNSKNAKFVHDVVDEYPQASAWWGFNTATDQQKLDAFIRRSQRSRFIPLDVC